MSEFEVKVKIDARDLYLQLKNRIEGFHGITKNYRLHKDLAETWFGEDDWVAHFVPCKLPKASLVSSGRWVGSRRAYIWDPTDKYGRNYGQVQWTGDNGSGVPSSEWRRADDGGHEGHAHWANWAKRYRWKKFLREYAAPTIIDAIKRGEYK